MAGIVDAAAPHRDRPPGHARWRASKPKRSSAGSLRRGAARALLAALSRAAHALRPTRGAEQSVAHGATGPNRCWQATPATDATMLRTTTAPTMFNAGVKVNALPQQAEAVINFRIRPGDSVEGVLAHVRVTLATRTTGHRSRPHLCLRQRADAGRRGLERRDLPGAGSCALCASASPEAQIVVAPYVTNWAPPTRATTRH